MVYEHILHEDSLMSVDLTPWLKHESHLKLMPIGSVAVGAVQCVIIRITFASILNLRQVVWPPEHVRHTACI